MSIPHLWLHRSVVVNTVLILLCGCSEGYEVSSDKVEFVRWDEGRGNSRLELHDANPDSFEVIGKFERVWYGMDDTHVYLNDSLIVGASPKSFEVLGAYYAKDDKRAYSGAFAMDVENLAQFKVLRPSNGTILSIASDTEDSLFFRELSVPEGQTRLVGTGWATDGKSVYFGPERLDGADPISFTVLNDNYAKDDDSVFCRSFMIEEADVETFVVMGEYTAKDRYKEYVLHKAN